MKRIIIDAEKCVGCKNCALACMGAHRHDSEGGSIYDLNLTDRALEARNKILMDAENRYKPLFCRHCTKPGCVNTCMSGALVKDPESGLVLYDREKCAACFMCVMSCPFGVLKPDKVTGTWVVRCDFCADVGGDPSCVKQCPTKAIAVKEV